MRKTILFLLLPIAAWAQLSLSENYQFNALANNPAFAGERGNFGVTAMLGQQFNGTPTPFQVSQILSIEGKLNNESNALGFQGYRSAITGYVNNGLSFIYSHEWKTDSDVRLKFGLNAGFLVAPNYIGTTNIVNRFKPYFGPGFAAMFQSGFLGIGAPSLIGQADAYTQIDKNIKAMGGYRFGSDEGLALNISVLGSIATRPEDQSAIHTNFKAWLANKLGIGASFRFQNGLHKTIPTLELRVSETSTLGLSYDKDPYRFLQLDNNNYYSRGIFQLTYKYDAFPIGSKSPLLNQF
ncbi:type IX secretion system membrane protein PorP/SprF [Marinilongibacter aquaticus]|uniref:type IX secretion system membrane protein PorP/SprF n=1 Tax=Marinilongibacter aquaticus TaxID=2975157 RepID=UPI0021BDE5B1|nr:type IX secretion system membrane protein PorP/SprF [Marinilongibacter aquaticus]UBM60492.1 type IX secretion system membrane protein PorP/SprF [Marinilongibacter aquaticus]